VQVRRGDIVIGELNPTKGSDTVGYTDVKILDPRGVELRHVTIADSISVA
jgi:hypothetical protein